MIAKQYRFRNWDGLIQIVLKKGHAVRTENFGLKSIVADHPYVKSRFGKLKNTRITLNKGMKLSPKFAVVVSGKVTKSSVSRNRMRRRVYEWIRLNMNNMDQNKLYVVFINSERVKTLKYIDLDTELKELLTKA